MPEDLKVSQTGSSPLPPPFRGLHSPGVRKHCQIIFACNFRKSSIIRYRRKGGWRCHTRPDRKLCMIWCQTLTPDNLTVWCSHVPKSRDNSRHSGEPSWDTALPLRSVGALLPHYFNKMGELLPRLTIADCVVDRLTSTLKGLAHADLATKRFFAWMFIILYMIIM